MGIRDSRKAQRYTLRIRRLKDMHRTSRCAPAACAGAAKRHPQLLAAALPGVRWVSPLASDDYAEYRDASTTAVSRWGQTDILDLNDPNIHGRPGELAIYADDDNDYTTKSLFFQQNLSFYDRAIVTFGARQDWMDLRSDGLYSSDSDDFSESSIRAAFSRSRASSTTSNRSSSEFPGASSLRPGKRALHGATAQTPADRFAQLASGARLQHLGALQAARRRDARRDRSGIAAERRRQDLGP